MEHKQDLGHKELRHKLNRDDDVVVQPSDGSGEPVRITTNSTTLEPVDEQDVSFFHDFIAGGVAGSASVVVGHPMDTLKVRMQTSKGNASMWSLATSYGGLPSLFRGMAAPLSTACVINAIIFSSYGWSSRMYDEHIGEEMQMLNAATPPAIHDSSVKAFTCGSFAGLVQALVICPQEHIKCRLQIQHGKGSPDHLYKGPLQAARNIVQLHGITGLYRGWCITCWREVPAFGAYFAFYDIFKDRINTFFANQELRQQQQQQRRNSDNSSNNNMTLNLPGEIVSTSSLEDIPPAIAHHHHTWLSSALAGGTTGALTWAMVYPFDVIKTQIQTMPMTTDASERKISAVTRKLVAQYGWQRLFRGLTVTCLRAFPVNGIIFPVYEYTLMHVCALEY
ncbi:mitochondrial carrier protein [Nitzschia inconspicua]|uniref:Mitochondrial carrier protein n=1 Tax=Nitzschia inconspicua TaxID=303405 RepID=A0A9K3LEZ1_9STRA|nr:mitochondrial carrier protein [Nitzschia inconspicua]